jgi:hypothetical protein
MSGWTVPLAAFGAGAGLFGLSAAHGGGLSLIWLPGVMVGVTWPETRKSVRSCFRRLGTRR